jgi:hypothetical protein
MDSHEREHVLGDIAPVHVGDIHERVDEVVLALEAGRQWGGHLVISHIA